MSPLPAVKSSSLLSIINPGDSISKGPFHEDISSVDKLCTRVYDYTTMWYIIIGFDRVVILSDAWMTGCQRSSSRQRGAIAP